MRMKSRSTPACTLLCALLTFCGNHIAVAQAPSGRPTSPAAIEHLTQGNARYKVREFEKAVEEYKAGALIEAAAIFDYNLGQCYRQLAKYPDAIWHYERYLRSGVATPEENESINRWIEEMKGELEQRAKSTPPTEPATMQPQPVIVQSRAAPWYHDAFGWGLTGAGVVVSAVGAALLVDAASLRDDANMTSSEQQQNALHDKADSRALGGTILAIGGGALLVTGIVKLAIHDREKPPAATAGTWNVGFSPNGVFVFGRF